jgi:hypothetical protein
MEAYTGLGIKCHELYHQNGVEMSGQFHVLAALLQERDLVPTTCGWRGPRAEQKRKSSLSLDGKQTPVAQLIICH